MDKFSKEKRSKIMAAIKSKDTKPELALRKALSAQGLRFRLHYGKHKIDIAFPKEKIAIFVDGCFWHKCPKHFRAPKSNKKYWIPKIEGNVKRDRKVVADLMGNGWTVIRVWEHEL